MKKITYTGTARKAFRKLVPDAQDFIHTKLVRYVETGAGDVTTLQGVEGSRLRAGDFRVIFVETDTTIEIRAVGHRRDICR